MSNLKAVCQQILCRFPKSQIDFAFAYGSGVFQQNNQSDKNQQMLDLIFVTKNSNNFHEENFKYNFKDYSVLKYLGADKVTIIQRQYGARCYFNPNIPVNSRIIKYGIIQTDDLIRDLLDWETLYIAGRLHKPVLFLNAPNSPIKDALHFNLKSALNSALLLLPKTFDEKALFLTIAGLSYTGDFRMVIGEDINKVSNIVMPNFRDFQNMYRNILLADTNLIFKTNGVIQQNMENSVICNRLISLPRAVARTLVKKTSKKEINRDIEDIMCDLIYGYDIRIELSNAIRKIVSHSSKTQSFKGIFTGGLSKSFNYLSKKLKKWQLSLIRKK